MTMVIETTPERRTPLVTPTVTQTAAGSTMQAD